MNNQHKISITLVPFIFLWMKHGACEQHKFFPGLHCFSTKNEVFSAFILINYMTLFIRHVRVISFLLFGFFNSSSFIVAIFYNNCMIIIL